MTSFVVTPMAATRSNLVRPVTNTFNDWSAAAGITYTYSVKACNEFGCSSPSDHAMGWRAGDDNPLSEAIYLPFTRAAK